MVVSRAMRPPVWSVAPVVAAPLLAACFDFNATTAGGPVADGGIGNQAPTLDATTPNGDGGVGASRDATVGEGDAGTAESDASSSAVDAGSHYCTRLPASPKVILCDDFDDDSLPGPWTSFKTTGGLLAETDAGAASPPNSLDETTLALALYDPIDVSLRKQPLSVPSLPATLRFGFSIEPLQIDTSSVGAIVLGAVDFLDAAGNRYTVELAINTQNAAPALVLAEQSGFVDGGAPYLPHPLPPNQPLPMSMWSDVVIEIDWTSAGAAQASVSVNGGDELSDVVLAVTVRPTFLQVGIGTSYVNEPSPGWELRYDNVRFTVE